MWVTGVDPSGTMSFVRNLYWDGFTFFTRIASPEYGGVYFGLGVPNFDIAFML